MSHHEEQAMEDYFTEAVSLWACNDADFYFAVVERAERKGRASAQKMVRQWAELELDRCEDAVGTYPWRELLSKASAQVDWDTVVNDVLSGHLLPGEEEGDE